MSNEVVKCAYCGKEKNKDEMISSTITFRDRNPYTGKPFVNKKTNLYCSGKCAGYDQMAHEG